MTLFEEIVSELGLITEISQQYDDRIIDAIKGMKRVRMTYYDGTKDRKGKKERYILPVAYGLSKANNPVVRAYEYYGSSKRGLTTPPNNRLYPKWKMFRLDGIHGWSNERRTFNKEEIQTKLGGLQGLNTAGDKGMTEIYALSPLCSNSSDVNITKPLKIKTEPIKKTDITPEINPQNTIDNSTNNQYVNKNNNLEAPETAPIKKTDIVGQQLPNEQPQTGNETTNVISQIDTKPITKDEVLNGEKNNDLSNNPATDLMHRMDNLNNNDNNEEEQWQDKDQN